MSRRRRKQRPRPVDRSLAEVRDGHGRLITTVDTTAPDRSDEPSERDETERPTLPLYGLADSRIVMHDTGLHAVQPDVTPADTALPDDELSQPIPLLPDWQQSWLDRHMADDMRQLRRELKRQGWSVVEGEAGRHSKAYPPGVDPAAGGLPYVPLPTTIGEGRGFANLVGALRRLGFTWKGR